MAVWEAGSATNLRLMCCPLCSYDRDSRDHLFFRCTYSAEVWGLVRDMADMGNVDNSWSSIIQWIEGHAQSNSLESIVSNLLVAASTYFLWQERNSRLFSRDRRNANVLSKIIIETVRLKLMGFRVGGDVKQKRLLDKWRDWKQNVDIDPG
ncbi:hypothetical protein HanRHA438_Chr00c04g0845041 [Helianthus annuus]|nr:hypothetical protein HanRHA438_Chr00c04g0845041 [Helianthus annuus]